MLFRILFFLLVSFYPSVGLMADPVTVYIMDNGVRMDHVDFEGVPFERVAIIKEKADPASPNGLPLRLLSYEAHVRLPGMGRDNMQDKGQREAYGDHGTLMAGLVVETAPSVKLVSVRTLNEAGEGKWSDLLKGVHWILNHHVAGQAAVANLSLGGVPEDPRIGKMVAHAIDQLVKDGVSVVTAAGNDAEDVPDRIPSSLDSVISVGAVSFFNFRLRDSNFGSCVDVYARGENLKGPGSKHSRARVKTIWTSVAAAVVTGHVAAFLGAHPDAKPEEVKQWVLGKSEKGKVKNFPGPRMRELKEKSLLFGG